MKRTQKSQKRTKFLFLLIVLTAILSITATYAWFSTQRDVQIANLEVKIESAQNLQISLDGENWSQVVTIKDMKQLYGTYTPDTGDTTVYYQAEVDEHRNYIPTELLPVSSCGTVASGNLKFVTGKVDGTTLSNITACSEADITVGATIASKEANNSNHPYLAFDIYLRNLSRRSGDVYTQDEADADAGDDITDEMVGTPKPGAYDPLMIAETSNVWIESGKGVAGTGLENGIRMAFIPYNTTAELTATGSTVRTTTAANGKEKVSIWEPNSKAHTEYVVNNNKRGIDATTAPVETYPVNTEAAFTGTTTIETNSVPDEDDILVSTLKVTRTVKTTYDVDATTLQYLVTPDTPSAVTSSTYTTDSAKDTDAESKYAISLKPNAISKVRVYLWLEGQDPDCVDLASTGKQVNATVKLEKPVYESTESGTTYDTPSPTATPGS